MLYCCFMEFINSGLAKLIVILLALIAIVALCLKNRPRGESNIKIHLWYIGSIASLTIVALLSHIIVGNSDHANMMNFISFASTLSSMILSILAIFITVSSERSLERVKDSLDELPKTVQHTVVDSINQMKDVSDTVKQMAIQSEESQSNTISKIQELLDKIDEHIKNGFTNTQERIDSIMTSLDDMRSQTPIKSDEFEVTKEIASHFVEHTSIACLQLIFACEEYENRGLTHPISIDKLIECFESGEVEKIRMYFFACLVTMSSLSFVTYQQIDPGNFDMIMLGTVNAEIKAAYKSRLEKEQMFIKIKSNLADYYNELEADSQGSDEKQQ